MTVTGRCLCGAISFRTEAEPAGASMCHCGQCRRQSGGIWASAFVDRDALEVDDPDGQLRWFASSENGRRGFCARCGGFLFWEDVTETTRSFALGALDTPTGIRLKKHIFTDGKADWYDLPDDGLPRS